MRCGLCKVKGQVKGARNIPVAAEKADIQPDRSKYGNIENHRHQLFKFIIDICQTIQFVQYEVQILS